MYKIILKLILFLFGKISKLDGIQKEFYKQLKKKNLYINNSNHHSIFI